MMKANLHNL